MTKVGLLFEMVGFVMASFFIVVLKIEAIKHIADRMKDLIIQVSKKDNEFDFTGTFIRIISVFFISFLWTRKAIRISVQRWIKNHFNNIKYWQYPTLAIPVFLHLCQATYITLLFVISIIFDKCVSLLAWIANKMTGKETVTNLMIILGTIILLAGLIIQLIAVW